ncbi:hypothetical protein C8R45DRAFT_1105445 [Mycena sanguinolenta]|nr:hypothetical protein C8R45DRAFT_1105445 [Mycena sanguinolenta]
MHSTHTASTHDRRDTHSVARSPHAEPHDDARSVEPCSRFRSSTGRAFRTARTTTTRRWAETTPARENKTTSSKAVDLRRARYGGAMRPELDWDWDPRLAIFWQGVADRFRSFHGGWGFSSLRLRRRASHLFLPFSVVSSFLPSLAFVPVPVPVFLWLGSGSAAV